MEQFKKSEGGDPFSWFFASAAWGRKIDLLVLLGRGNLANFLALASQKPRKKKHFSRIKHVWLNNVVAAPRSHSPHLHLVDPLLGQRGTALSTTGKIASAYSVAFNVNSKPSTPTTPTAPTAPTAGSSCLWPCGTRSHGKRRDDG